MIDNKVPGRSVSAAGPHSQSWQRLGEATREQFNTAAHGATEGKQKIDQAKSDHNIEPSVQEKKHGAALDKAASQKRFDQHKAQLIQQRSKGQDLGF